MDYCILGGMPAVVKSFVENGNVTGTLELQKQLLLDYEEYIRKYAEGLDQEKILSVWRHVPAQLAKENKKSSTAPSPSRRVHGNIRAVLIG